MIWGGGGGGNVLRNFQECSLKWQIIYYKFKADYRKNKQGFLIFERANQNLVFILWAHFFNVYYLSLLEIIAETKIHTHIASLATGGSREA